MGCGPSLNTVSDLRTCWEFSVTGRKIDWTPAWKFNLKLLVFEQKKVCNSPKNLLRTLSRQLPITREILVRVASRSLCRLRALAMDQESSQPSHKLHNFSYLRQRSRLQFPVNSRCWLHASYYAVSVVFLSRLCGSVDCRRRHIA